MKVGLEVHQQLATGKLFCRCPSELSDEVGPTFLRRLRPAGGEERTVDAAAEFQGSRRLTFRYEVSPASCLVEMDEEPPRPIDDDALDTALTVALLLGARPVDEVEVMRKIVVDGSNTSGFQRTALIAVDGAIEVGGKRISIPSVCLEEDAARKVREADGEIVYRLDRLGIPLVEIATGPDIRSGTEARAVAEELGAIVRATRRVRRGIGTIREDVNVSAEGGHRIEIKGVQELRKIQEYVAREEARQERLLRVREELNARNASVGREIVNVSELLSELRSGPVASATRKGGAVLALPLTGFAGLLGVSGTDEERLGRELADHARARGLGGILHSDELPAYGITADHVAQVRDRLHLGTTDAFVLAADASKERAERGLRAVAARATAALEGIPGETRDPLPDGSTRYSRPLPGRDRMYPETDVPPVPIGADRLDRLRTALPERPGETLARLTREHGLVGEVARQLVYGPALVEFEELVGRRHNPALVARLLLHDLPAVAGEAPEGAHVPAIGDLDALLTAAESGRIGKEGIPAVLEALSRGTNGVQAAIAATGLEGFTATDLSHLVHRVVGGQLELVRARGKLAFSALMGDVMKEVRGRRDGREVAEELRRAIDEELQRMAGGTTAR